MIRKSSFINLSICLSSFKLLFLNSYVSTDFDVHRNWMAITYNLPIKDWYFDTTSEWTLDYPPLFAAFEFFLALIAHFLNLQDILQLSESPIRTPTSIKYQKITVIIADLVYYYSVYRLCIALEPLAAKVGPSKKRKKEVDSSHRTISNERQNLLDVLFQPDLTSSVALLLLLQPGLLLVDHIHFQYNGLLSGIFLLSVAEIISGNYATGSFWFATLLNFKHIYLYCAPAYGIYLLSSHCFARDKNQSRVLSTITNVLRLGFVVSVVFVITYLPFFDHAILSQIAARLFPFKRGLTHAYWAPNIWSLYNTADKVLATILKKSSNVKFDLDSISGVKPVSSTSGLVQEYEHQYLPSVSPSTTFMLVAVFIIPLIIKFLLKSGESSPTLFMRGLTLATFTSFMFGWHVHEKAIILVLLPLIPISLLDNRLRRAFLRLTLAGTYSLFPLLYQPAEYLTKLSLLLAYYFYAVKLLHLKDRDIQQSTGFFNSLWHKLYNLLDGAFVILIVLTEAYITLIHGRLNYSWNPLSSLNKYEFLPLMLTSSFSAFGITLSYLELLYDFVKFFDEEAAA